MSEPAATSAAAAPEDPRSEARFTLPRPECAEPWLWRSEDIGGAEDEVHDLLRQAVLTLKPRRCVETGTWRGRGALAIASALQENGRGELWSLELDEQAAAAARDALREAGLEDWAHVVTGSSLEWSPPGAVDLFFLDSAASLRGREFVRLYRSMHRRSVLLVHDTGDHKRQPRRQFGLLSRLGLAAVVWWPTPRGLAFVQPRFPLTRSLRLSVAEVLLRRFVPAMHRIEDRAAGVRASLRGRRPKAPVEDAGRSAGG